MLRAEKRKSPGWKRVQVFGEGRTAAVQTKALHLVVSHRWSRLEGLRVEIASGERLVAVLGVTEVPAVPAILSTISAGLAIGVVGNVHRAGVQSVIVEAKFPLHPRIAGLFEAFQQLEGGEIRDVRLEARQEALPLDGLSADGVSVALSGGKDSLFALDAASREGVLGSGTRAIFLGGVSPEWRSELAAARRLAQHFGLPLKVCTFQYWPYSRIGILRPQLRGIWRELVTIPVARTCGRKILTGLNADAMFGAPDEFPNSRWYFSELRPTLMAVEDALDCQISTVPGEFAVYRQIRSHPLFKAATSGSCLNPATCDDSAPCGKHRVFRIYEKLLEGRGMSPADARFWLSPECIGDANLNPVARQVLARAERKGRVRVRSAPKMRGVQVG